GRHIARTKRYIRNYAHEVEPADLPAYVVQEARRGDGWVKLVGDWISRDDGDLAPSFPAEAFAAAIEAAHAEGAKVTAHCFGRDVLQGLLDAGIDCLEHGTGLSVDQVEQMATQGVALVPTVLQTDKFPVFADQGREKFPAYADTMESLHARRREALMAAHEAGVALYVGSDGGGTGRHGYLWEEVRAMHEMGMPAPDVVAAASWRAREWLGFSGLEEGAEADFVVLDRDPRGDLSVLAEPERVVLRGSVVAAR
ncbi:MAG: amidohydrolase family protein, partial [Nocardioides sp.]|nr:amidohydrolase family protein [Nocardioides sp.]